MQLRCWCLGSLLVSIWASAAAAQNVAEGSFGNQTSVYVDGDNTSIVTNATELSSRFNQAWQLGARYLVDVVSSASVDVVTQASAKMEDIRHELGGSGGYRSDEGLTLLGSYSYSTEHDWESHNANLSGGIETLGRNLTLGINLGFQDNTITRADTFGFREKLRSYTGTLSATYLMSPQDLLHLAFALTHHDGYQASPYRFLTVDQLGYAENVPGLRTRFAVVARYHRDVGAGFSLRTHLRLYTDTYAVSSVTAGSELGFERGSLDWLVLVRGYAQAGARFYRSVYSKPQRYMTLDKELSPFWDVFAGGAVGWMLPDFGLFRSVRVELRALANFFQYLDFARLDERFGVTATLGLSGTL